MLKTLKDVSLQIFCGSKKRIKEKKVAFTVNWKSRKRQCRIKYLGKFIVKAFQWATGVVKALQWPVPQ